MLEMAINNVEMGSELDRVHILTCCGESKISGVLKTSQFQVLDFGGL